MTPDALSTSEAFLLAHLVAWPASRRADLLRAHPTLDHEALPQTLLETLAPLALPWHRRAAPLHESWVEEALRDVPVALRAAASPWLREGVGEGDVEPEQMWVQRRCLTRFPLGPLHLQGMSDLSPGHLGQLAVMSQEALLEAVMHLGLYGLSLTLVRAERRQMASVLAGLPEEHRVVLLSALRRASEEPETRLRLRMQEAVLRLRERPRSTSELARHLGLDFLALACAHRFELEGRFIAARLPRALGRRLVRLLSRGARRSRAESQLARLAIV